jgi:hypothetical protein
MATRLTLHATSEGQLAGCTLYRLLETQMTKKLEQIILVNLLWERFARSH